ncbi:MAG: P-loop NTPase fold protein [Candidatus Pacebacteria bacterium]|nr:P-loop NTPase fold protein [Candidatus Paceibacterota bacterium]
MLICITLLGYFYFSIDPIRVIRTQKLRERKSYIYYLFWGLFSAVLVLTIRAFFWDSLLFGVNIILLLFLIISYAVYLTIIRKISLVKLYFGPDTTSINDDFLGFKEPAKSAALEIIKTEADINIVCICGRIGSGKSSFLSMIVESIPDKNSFLYTYISLTETNEAKDFSKLFNERWFDTIASRYPKININILIPMLDSVFRDFNGGVFNKLFSTIGSSDRPIIDKDGVEKDVLCKFGGVYDFREKHWIIVIDELERAKPGEMYRVVEVIERFKNMSFSHFPIKLIFIIPFDPEMIGKLRSELPGNSSIFQTSYFLNDNKTINRRLQVPFGDNEGKDEYLTKELGRIFGDTAIDILKKRSQPIVNGDGFGYIFNELIMQTPRFIKRCIENIETKKNILDRLEIRYYTPTQIIALGYIITNTKYLFLFDFIRNNIDRIIRDYVSTKRSPGEYESVKIWIEANYPTNKKEWENSFKLIRCLSKSFDYYLRSDNYDIFEMSKSLDSPENLKNCLSEINKISYYQKLLFFANLSIKDSRRFKEVKNIDFIELVKFLLRTNSDLLKNPIFIVDFERRLRLEDNYEIFNLLIEFINEGGVLVINYLPILAYYISDFNGKKLLIVELMKALIGKDSTIIVNEQFIVLFKTFFEKYKKSKSFDLDDTLYDIINNNFIYFLAQLGEESFIIYKRIILNKKDIEIGLSLLEKINSREDIYLFTQEKRFWNEVIKLLYGLDFSYYDENNISRLLDLMGSADIFNDVNIPQQFNFLNKLIFSKYFVFYSERIRELIIHYSSAFKLRPKERCDPALLIDSFLKVCFHGEKLNIEMGYNMLKDFMDYLSNLWNIFDVERVISIFIMVIESDNVDFDHKHEVLNLLNSSYYEKTIDYRSLWVNLVNSYYRVFEDNYIKNKRVIYENSQALLILRDYLDPFDEKILANVRGVAERGLENYHNYIAYYWKVYKLDIPGVIPDNLNIKEIEERYARIIMPFNKLMEISKKIKINTDPYAKRLILLDDSDLSRDDSLIRYKMLIGKF